MHFGDYTFIFLLALVLFGPKKLPEIGKQLGKLLAEFRRASNEFKFQIQEELRNMEDEERRKKLTEQQAALASTTLAAEPAPESSEVDTGPAILPPSTGTPVSTSRPYATPVETPEPTPDVPGTPEVTAEPSAPVEVSSAPPAESEAPAPAAETSNEPVSLAGVESGTSGTQHG